MVAYQLVDDVAESYLDLLDDVDEEIDELEENIDRWPAEKTGAGCRSCAMTCSTSGGRSPRPGTRSARSSTAASTSRGGSPFSARCSQEVERHFATTYDKLLRATESIEYARDLVAAARDYQQARMSIDQNEVVKRLTAIASLMLVPTFIVGLYGQNSRDMPESVGVRLLVVVEPDHRHDRPADHLLPPQALDLGRR